MVEPIFDYQFRLILIGDSTVGKSSLLKYFTDGKFAEDCDPTVGVDFHARLLEIKPGARVKLQMWDTAGQERFKSITRSYYRHSVGAMIVYDITKRKSFDHMTDWLEEAKLQIGPNKASYIVVGHKCDAEELRAVSTREGQQFAKHHDMQFIETSAKTGKNVEEAFQIITKDIFDMLEEGKIKVEDGWDGVKNGYTRPRESFTLAESEAQSGGCC